MSFSGSSSKHNPPTEKKRKPFKSSINWYSFTSVSTQRRGKDGVCHPPSYVEKNPLPAGRKRETSSMVNPYGKDAFSWSDDDDFQL